MIVCQNRIESDHPEISGQINEIQDTLAHPDIIIKSKTDTDVELFYRPSAISFSEIFNSHELSLPPDVTLNTTMSMECSLYSELLITSAGLYFVSFKLL